MCFLPQDVSRLTANRVKFISKFNDLMMEENSAGAPYKICKNLFRLSSGFDMDYCVRLIMRK
jgi:hypothetical protein